MNEVKTITSIEEAKQYHQSWTKAIKKDYHPDVKSRFGEDLTDIFGPPATRKSVRLLSKEERESKLKAIKNYVNDEYYVSRGRLMVEPKIISLPALQIKAFEAYQQIIDPMTEQPVLYGLDLDDYALAEAFVSGVPMDIGLLYINTDIQRPLDLVRQAEYMFGNYDSGSFTGAIGRIDGENDRIIVDDGQQGTALTANHRVSTIGVNFSVRQSQAEDARLLLVTNIYKLGMKPFEIYRNQVVVATDDAMRNGVESIKPSDKAAYWLHQIVSDKSSAITFKFEDAQVSKGECRTVKQILKLFDRYADSDYQKRWAFQTAIKTQNIAWPNKPVTSEGIWALSELYTQMKDQIPNAKKVLTDTVIHEIAGILHKHFSNSNKMWNAAKDVRDKLHPKGTDETDRYHTETARGPIMAAMIVDLCHNYTAMKRELDGKPTVKDLPLPSITHDGRPVVMSLGATKPDGKAFVRDTEEVGVELPTTSNVEVEEFLNA